MTRFALLLAIALLLALPARADKWRLSTPEDVDWIAAVVNYPGLGMGFACHVAKAGGTTSIDSIWFEETIAPADQFLLSVGETLIPAGPHSKSRADVILFVDQIGYRLPRVIWNELSGGWETFIAQADPMIADLGSASRLVMQVGQTAVWELPATDLGAALQEARTYCAQAVPASTDGATPRNGAGFPLPPTVTQYMNARCNGSAQLDPGGVQAGDLDGDGQPDVVLDWADITCPGERRSAFCGAANCEIAVFLSTRGYVDPHQRLAVGVTIVAHPSGRLGLGMGGTAAVCARIDCRVPWLWNGADFVQVP